MHKCFDFAPSYVDSPNMGECAYRCQWPSSSKEAQALKLRLPEQELRLQKRHHDRILHHFSCASSFGFQPHFGQRSLCLPPQAAHSFDLRNVCSSDEPVCPGFSAGFLADVPAFGSVAAISSARLSVARNRRFRMLTKATRVSGAQQLSACTCKRMMGTKAVQKVRCRSGQRVPRGSRDSKKSIVRRAAHPTPCISQDVTEASSRCSRQVSIAMVRVRKCTFLANPIRQSGKSRANLGRVR